MHSKEATKKKVKYSEAKSQTEKNGFKTRVNLGKAFTQWYHIASVVFRNRKGEIIQIVPLNKRLTA